MKKTVIVFFFLVGFYFTGFSQTIIKPAIGMNFTSLSNDPLSYETTGRVGWQIGGSIAMGDQFYFEPGIFWEKNNWNLQNTDPQVPEFQNDISAIKIPVFVGINLIGNANDDNFHIMGGPTMRIVTDVNPGTTGKTKDDFSNFIFGMNFGGGISMGKIFIDAGYEWGLTNIYKNETNDIRSRGFWLNAGFRLKFL